MFLDNKKNVYIRPEDTLEFIYEMSGKWKDIDQMKEDLRKIIRYFKQEKFDKLYEEFKLEL